MDAIREFEGYANAAFAQLNTSPAVSSTAGVPFPIVGAIAALACAIGYALAKR